VVTIELDALLSGRVFQHELHSNRIGIPSLSTITDLRETLMDIV
jgi:hypothetical protein